MSRPLSVIFSSPPGGIHTQLIRSCSTSTPSMAAAALRGEDGSGQRAILGERLPDPVPGARLKTASSLAGHVSDVG
jgi:hypothetical protein